MKPSELKKLLDAATPGPWVANHAHHVPPSVWINGPALCRVKVADCHLSDHDATVIATSRNILPLLLQLWEAAGHSDTHRVYEALAALDQHGEGEK